jgi:hypothetical protein
MGRQGAESSKRPSAPPRSDPEGRCWEKLTKELFSDISQKSGFVYSPPSFCRVASQSPLPAAGVGELEAIP